MAIKYNAAGKIVAKKFTTKRLEAALADNDGFCLACGHCQHGCEPDARKYHCDGCGKNFVYGAEEIAIMGYVR